MDPKNNGLDCDSEYLPFGRLFAYIAPIAFSKPMDLFGPTTILESSVVGTQRHTVGVVA